MKDKFLKDLREILIDLDDSDVDETIAYFDELIEDKIAEGYKEDEVINDLGEPKEVAMTIIGSNKNKTEDQFTYEEIRIDDENDVVVNYNINDISEICFEGVSHNIEIIDTDGDEVIIKYPKSDKFRYDISLNKRGKLAIEYNYNGIEKFFKNVFVLEGSKVAIFLPKETDISLDIENISGKVDVFNINLHNIEIENVSGAINMGNIKAKNIDLSTTSGNYYFDNIEAKSINLETVSGKMDLYAIVSKDINLESVSGKIDIEINGDADDYDINIDKPMKDISIDGKNNRHYELNIETISGNVEYNFI